MNVSVRDVDPEVFREFRIASISTGKKTGTALTEAISEWAEKNKKRRAGKKKSVADIKAVAWEDGITDMSERVDEYLYGGKR